ncbi:MULTISPECIES: flagellar basal body rod protein FlgC [Caproicibacterium]|uniref:Flagellar basal-body rod protein FlgC n=1 Tax=Caproicibacterium argilliputei TaxID=3030016 RepID=A0AA97H165_9FIRM|nr:flagellar basal body rod protein FlgC [Caproicibacterium argilliputei]WOC31290.1 flagellar basal body rod protein FlgC [Caproicibacterium argilliputei]
MAFLGSMDIAGSALTAERYRMNTIMQNISNANIPAEKGKEPYRRKQLVLQERPLSFQESLQDAQNTLDTGKSGGVQVDKIVESDRDFKSVYDPDNPNANDEGYVLYPNVDTTEERVDLLAASNAYSTNLTALNVVKAMAMKALSIGGNS